jgi:hypothetical protein
MCQEPWYCIEKGLEFLGHYKSGEKQEKQYHRLDIYDMWLEVELGSGKVVQFARYSDRWEIIREATAYLEGCKKLEKRKETWKAQYPYYEYRGTHVLPEFSEDREKLKDAWFCLYMVADYDEEYKYDCGKWGLTNYYWASGGAYYNQGSWGSPSDCTHENSDKRRSLLYANVLGVDVLLDETEWGEGGWGNQAEDTYYYITETFILDYFGVPVFMYGYTLYWYDRTTYDYVIDHIRYGYFMGDSERHYRTEKFFTTEDLRSKYTSGDSTMHDVFGLGEKTGFYAHGRCCGFAIKTTREREEREEYVVSR